MYILGFSYGYHDSSIALIKSNDIISVYSEERFSRKKHDRGFPSEALKNIIDDYNISPNQIQQACYYEDTILKFDRIQQQFLTEDDFAAYLLNRYNKGTLKNPLIEISEALNIDISKVKYIEHHISHLFTSLSMINTDQDFDKPLKVFTLDGVGEVDTANIYSINSLNKFKISKISTSSFPHSIGLFYSAITSFLGFEVNDAEYKVMGLAAYGEPTYLDQFKKIINYTKEKGLILDMEFFDFSPNALFPYSVKFIETFGPPAPSSSSYVEEFTSIEDVKNDIELSKYANIASSAQACIEYLVNEIVSTIDLDPDQLLLFSGGVALNSKLNYSLLCNYNLLIPPDPGDGGSSLGAALASNFKINKIIPKFKSPYLGYDINRDNLSVKSSLYEGLNIKQLDSLDDICESAAEILCNDLVIGWAHSKAEFGPRALGNRSIIASPNKEEAQLFVNKAVKFREPFRPFAPAVLEDHIENLFEISQIDLDIINNPLNFMLATLPVKEKAYSFIPACIHVDGTSRVQIVRKQTNPLFHQLITNYYRLSGIPAVLNTSFNLKGEPIINNSHDAISTFLRSGMYALFINKYSITKN